MEQTELPSITLGGFILGALGWLLFFHLGFFIALTSFGNIYCDSPWWVMMGFWILTFIAIMFSVIRNRIGQGLGIMFGVGLHFALAVSMYALPLNLVLINHIMNGDLLIPLCWPH